MDVSWPTLLATFVVMGLLALSVYIGQKLWFAHKFRFKWRCPVCLFYFESNMEEGLKKVKWSHNTHYHPENTDPTAGEIHSNNRRVFRMALDGIDRPKNQGGPIKR